MPKVIILGVSNKSLGVAQSFLQQGIWPVILDPSGPISNWAGRLPNYLKAPGYVTAELHFHQLIRRVYHVRGEICCIQAVNRITGEFRLFRCEHFYSSIDADKLSTLMGYKLAANLSSLRELV